MFKDQKYYLPKFWESIFLVLLFLLGGSLFGGLIVGIAYLLGVKIGIEKATLALYILPFIPLLIYIYLRALLEKKNQKVFGSNREVPLSIKLPISTKSRVYSWIGIVVGTFVISFAIEPINSLYQMPDALKEIYNKMSEGDIQQFVTVALCAPLLEEFMFRGTIERGLLSNYRKPAFAIVVSALFFGFIHLNFWQGIGATIMGLFIGWIYYRMHSFWAVVVIHFINNSSAYLTALFLPKDLSNSSLREVLAHYDLNNLYYIIIASSILLTFLCIALINKNIPKGNSFFIANQDKNIENE